jgi:solute:Na+ symporter, SSS family
MTLAQFLEMRYSRRFRVFSGTLCWVSGVLNYGIFPAVTARFFIYFLGLPVHLWTLPGTGLQLNLTLGAVMAVTLGVTLFITLTGGQISVMVTDFIQGQISNIVFLTLLGVMLYLFPWNPIFFFILMFLFTTTWFGKGARGITRRRSARMRRKWRGCSPSFGPA